MICDKCQKENPDYAEYCSSCGTLLNPTANVTTRDNITSSLNEDTGPVSPKRRWGTAKFHDEMILRLIIRDYEVPDIQIDLHKDRTLGRSHDSYTPDIDLSAFDGYERGVSRQHALLHHQNDTIVLIDLGSINSTFLNGQRLIAHQPRIVRDGDEIRLGQLVLRVSFDDAP